MAKIQPSVLNIRLSIGQADTDYVDLSQCASIVNRRFYRQGLNWIVAGFTVTAAAVGFVTIAKLPNTWCVSNAWHKSYAAWRKQQNEAIADAGAQSAVAKYRDFKIFMSPAHVARGITNNAIPVDMANAPYLEGEWESTQIVIPNTAGVVGDTDEYTLHMVGVDTAASFGLILNYGASRAYPHSPDPVHPAVGASFFSEMFNVGMDDSEIVANATNKNDDLPYDQDNYPGAGANAPTLELVHETFFTPTTVSQKNRLSGTNVPCGLLEIANGVAGPINVIIHMVPGKARGYLTQPMQDM